MAIRFRAALVAPLFLAGCAQTSGIIDAAPPAADAAQAGIAPIKSGKMVIEFQIGEDAPRDWTITPDLSPDTLVLECPEGETVPVTFTTDLESRTIPMSMDVSSVLFDITVNDDIVALTELQCIYEITRYQGDFSAERSTAGDYAADLSSLLKTYFSPDGPGVILAISEGDQAPFEIAIGLDSIEDQVPRRPDEAFDIASVSKEFTAISILQLVERGQLELDAPLSTFFADLPNGNEITLHHLLTHTHGLPQIRTSATYDATVPQTLDISLDHIRAQEAKFEPGERYEYGNTSYFLLAIIAEQVSREDRETYIRENLLKPAGMSETYFITEDPAEDRRVAGYTEIDGEISTRTFDIDISFARGTGDIVSTLDDVRRWQRAVSNGTLLSADTFALATTPHTLNDGSKIARGYGFFHGIINGETIIYNTGDFYTHTRHFYMPARDLSITLNTNGTPQYDGGQSSVVWLQIIGKVFNRQFVEFFDDEIDLNDL